MTHFPVVIHHNPDCGTSRNVLAIITAAGYTPVVIDYLREGWTRPQLLALFAAAGLTAREALRETKSPAAELGLLDPTVSDNALIAAMIAHPILVNRPFVATPKGVKLCRPDSATVLDLLDRLPPGPFHKEDGSLLIDADGKRVWSHTPLATRRLRAPHRVMLTIRPARAADLAEITAIYSHAVVNGTASYEYDAPGLAEMTSRFEAIVGARFPYIVAQDEGRVLGYAYASHFRTRPAYRFMVEDSIYISAEAQGQGIGTLLLGELLARSEALGFRQMIAVIGDAAVNLASARLHAAMGFVECGRIKGSGFKFGRWCDTLMMQRALNGGAETLPEA